jgi:hypothetical protein
MWWGKSRKHEVAVDKHVAETDEKVFASELVERTLLEICFVEVFVWFNT